MQELNDWYDAVDFTIEIPARKIQVWREEDHREKRSSDSGKQSGACSITPAKCSDTIERKQPAAVSASHIKTAKASTNG